jgi:hypothetical protein
VRIKRGSSRASVEATIIHQSAPAGTETGRGVLRPRPTAAWLVTFPLGRRIAYVRDPGLRPVADATGLALGYYQSPLAGLRK